MKNLTQFMQEAKHEKDEREYGYEGDMAITQLKTIVRQSDALLNTLKPETDLPEWVQNKITLAMDYIQTSHDYIMTEGIKESIDETKLEQVDEISKETAQSYLKKTVDPVEGMPRPGFKNFKTRMAGIKRASKIVVAPAKNTDMKNVLQQRATARAKVDKIYQELRRKKEARDKEGL
jgi:hypothetical protein